MVLGSAQYKRQDDEIPGDELLVHDSMCDLSTPSGGVGGGGSSSGGGHVRFVDSTIRYHITGTSYWHGRSGLEKGLIILTLVLALFCTVMLVVVSSNVHDRQLHYLSHESRNNKLCLTPECVKVAANILSAADLKADPCVDFYQYACAGWEKITPIPDGRTSWSMFEKLWEGNQLIMKNALDEGIENGPAKAKSEAEVKVMDYYQSCIDVNGTIEKLGGKPLLDMIDSVKIGGWPIMDQDSQPSIKDKETFQTRLQYLQNDFQSSGFFSWSVGEDDKNSTIHVIQIDQGGLSLPTRDNYLDVNDTPIVEAFRELIVEVTKLLVIDKEKIGFVSREREDQIRRQAQGIVDFETKLANITIPSAKRRNEEDLYHNMTVGELEKTVTFLNWTNFLNNVFQKVGRKITPEEKIVVYAPEYLTNLTALIETYLNDTELQLDLENYMIMQLVKSYRPALAKRYRNSGKALEKALLGKESHPERWRVCVSDTDSVMGFALGAMFIRSSFNGNSKPEAQAMIDGIKTAFKKRMVGLEWMDEETRAAAVVKADAITDMIGFPDYILNKEDIDAKYADFRVNKSEYFENNIRFHRYLQMENLAKIDKPVNRTKWSMSPPTVNAYYTPTKNQIVFPAGLLQIPFFNLDYPRSLNYGAMGVVMGHELSHAFDDQGREYDEKGNMREWWLNSTLQEFNNRTACMEQQYSSYKSGETNVRGGKTLGENIADNGGMKAAFYAYQEWLKTNGIAEEQPLPGVNMTHNKLFFLSFSQVWCSKQTPQAKKLQVQDDPHAPARFRVIGVLSNSKEFAETFECPIDSPMNPAHKCEVW